MIVLAVPTRDSITAVSGYSIVQLVQQTSSEVVFLIAQGSYIPNNRIELVNNMLRSDATHILFIDSDMRFPSDTAERLMKHDKDIVGANYKQRTQDEWTAHKNNQFIGSTNKKGLEEVDSLGFGVILIKRSVFDGKLHKIPEPWFAMPYHTQDKKLVGEDIYFCTVARDNGFKVWVDHELSQRVKHIGSVEL